MRFCLIQSASHHYVPTLQKTSVRHAAYCDRHGISYLCHIGPAQIRFHPMWDRIPLIQNALIMGYQMVCWLDTDSIIADMDVSLIAAGNEFRDVGMAKHPGGWKLQPWHYNAGVTFFKNTTATMLFMERVAEIGQVQHPNWKVQATMLEVNDSLNVIQEIGARWNSTEKTNETLRPVIESFHGQPEALKKTMDRLAQLELER